MVSSWFVYMTILPLTERLVRPFYELQPKERVRGFIMMLFFIFGEILPGYCVFVKGGIKACPCTLTLTELSIRPNPKTDMQNQNTSKVRARARHARLSE